MAKFNLPDPRNEGTFVWVNGLVKREEAKVHVLDSAVQGGDAVWEGLRVRSGHVIQWAEHVQRLMDSAKALAFVDVPTEAEVWNAVQTTLAANNMQDGVHIRLTLTRGMKSTSGMDPRLNTFGPTLIALPEYKGYVYGEEGIKLVTASIRRNAPSFLDSKIHHANLLNNILAKIEANVAGADDALMLDERGFLAETNATNVFLVRDGKLLTPRATACLPGITRAFVLQMADHAGIPWEEKDLSLSEIYTAHEAFTTGTMGALAHVIEVDGRSIVGPGPITQKLNALYNSHILNHSKSLLK
jgi:branched-chain amino acid aminotransferase